MVSKKSANLRNHLGRNNVGDINPHRCGLLGETHTGENRWSGLSDSFRLFGASGLFRLFRLSGFPS